MTKTAKDNLKEHLWPYSDEDIAIIREEKTQLVTAAEFAEVHMEKLCIEKKLATAVEALGKISEVQNLNPFGKDFDVTKAVNKAIVMRGTASQALAEIGGEDD